MAVQVAAVITLQRLAVLEQQTKVLLVVHLSQPTALAAAAVPMQ
jgi:hypothetical protein